MDLKTEAQLTQEISEVWRMLDAEQTAFSRIIAEKDKEIERLKAAMNPYAAKNRGIPEESQKATAADDIKAMAKNLTQVATLLADRAECLLGKYSIRKLEKEAINPVPVRDFPAYWADLREYLFTIETGLGRIMSALDSAEL